MLNKQIA